MLSCANGGLPLSPLSRLPIVLLALGLIAAAPPPGWPEGHWQGHVALPSGATLPLTLDVTAGTAVLHSPAQGNAAIPATLEAAAGGVVLHMPAIGATFSPTERAGDVLDGPFVQHGATLGAHFERAPARRAADDTPVPPFPYETREFAIPAGGGVTLAATLDIPHAAGPVPGVLLIAGSGRQTRDEEVAGHKVFLYLADRLARAGIASLRYDKRGSGGSGGDHATATEAVLAEDAKAAFETLRAARGVAPGAVGLFGHSEGGIIAAGLAARDSQVRFVVLLSSPGQSGAETLVAQIRALALGAGAGAEAAEHAAGQEKRLLDAELAAPTPAAAAEAVRGILAAQGAPQAAIDKVAETAGSPWFASFLRSDPRPALSTLRVPVLAIAGSRDVQVVAARALPELRAALHADPQAKVVELDGLNHLLQPAGTGMPSEYGQIPQTMSPAVPEMVSAWIGAHAG